MTPDISIITFTLGGRDKYLIKCLDSVYDDIHEQLIYNENKIEHHLILQGCSSKSLESTLPYFKESPCYKLIIHEWPQNIGIGAGLNKIIPQCNGNLIFKMDDDCEIVSKDFFDRAISISKNYQDCVFSPQPLGLVNNMAGPPGYSRSIFHDVEKNMYYTLRNVNHVGGFARFAPKHIIQNFSFPNDLISGISGTEDGDFSSYCNHYGVKMFYVETGLAVEHMEGLGQQVRYPEYFKNRPGDLNTFKRWIK